MLKKIAMVLSLNVCRVTSLPEDCSPHDVHIAYIAGRSDLDPGPGSPGELLLHRVQCPLVLT